MILKLKKPTTITAKYKIITPMFIGDAEQSATWISPTSFKGALRFWWRALSWGRVYQQVNNEKSAMHALHKEESELFGHTDIGRGLLSIKITQPAITVISNFPSKESSGSSYLAYGLMGDKNNEHRKAIHEGVSFSVTLMLNDRITDAQTEAVEQALTALGLFGGLGSRARRANGSIQLMALNDVDYVINDKADYMQLAEKILSQSNKIHRAPYTAVSDQSLFAVSNSTAADARATHNALGAHYKDYRGQLSKLPSKKKKVFGLPLKGVDETARRASPLYFHIVEYANEQFAYSVLYLPTSIFHKDARHQNVDYSLTEDFTKAVGRQTV